MARAHVVWVLLGLGASACAGAPPRAAPAEAPGEEVPCEARWIAMPLLLEPIDEGPLTPEVEASLTEIVRGLAPRSDILELRAHGVACPGSSMQRDAEARAERVARELVARGVPRDRMSTLGSPVQCGAYCSCCCRSRAKGASKCSEACTEWDPPRTRSVSLALRVHERGACGPPILLSQ